MVTTRKYRDILHIGRHQRPQHYSIRQEIPWQDRPLVQRRHRIGVTERLVPPRGEVAGGAGRGRGAGSRPHAAGRRGGSGGGVLPVLLPESGARGARARHSGRGAARLLRYLLIGGLAPVPGVRALHHRRHERLRRPQGAPLRRAAGERDCRRGPARGPPHHELERGGGDREDGVGASGDDPALGTGGGRARRRLDRRHRATRAPDHLRHGRHLGRYRHRHGRALQRGQRP